jgi:predicted ATP-grasp superfamily ATP-dependent carboligase
MSSRLPAIVASTVGGRRAIVIRNAGADDRAALARLADLADRRLPSGRLLVAEADGELVAAIDATGAGEVVSDPFRVTLDVVELLRLRSRQLRAAA